ncbi:MAG: prolipoprotein diacylglyceryl transferase [Lachnospiraceae bacterium]|nr:prolipoprotein diacylglyceryl transferase [Lachnospiraceae bacterium]
MDTAQYLFEHAFYILVTVSVIPAFLWMWEFKEELMIKHFWQIALYLACLYGIGILSTFGVAELENIVLNENWANRRGWSVFITMPLFYLLLAKITHRDRRAVADILGVQVMLIYGFGRTACVFQGCCLGKFIQGTQHRWPLIFIEIGFLVVFVVVQGAKAFRRQFDGKSYPIFLIVYGFFRLFLEMFRDIEILQSYYGLFIGCAVFIVVGVIWLVVLHKSENISK